MCTGIKLFFPTCSHHQIHYTSTCALIGFCPKMKDVATLKSAGGGMCDTCAKFTNKDAVSKLLDGLGGRIDKLLERSETDGKDKGKDRFETKMKKAICRLFEDHDGEINRFNRGWLRRIQCAGRDISDAGYHGAIGGQVGELQDREQALIAKWEDEVKAKNKQLLEKVLKAGESDVSV